MFSIFAKNVEPIKFALYFFSQFVQVSNVLKFEENKIAASLMNDLSPPVFNIRVASSWCVSEQFDLIKSLESLSSSSCPVAIIHPESWHFTAAVMRIPNRRQDKEKNYQKSRKDGTREIKRRLFKRKMIRRDFHFAKSFKDKLWSKERYSVMLFILNVKCSHF